MKVFPEHLRTDFKKDISEEISFQKFCFKKIGPLVLLAAVFQGLSEVISRKPADLVVNYLITSLEWSKYAAISVGAFRLIYGNVQDNSSFSSRKVDYIQIPHGQFMSMNQEIIRLKKELEEKNLEAQRVFL